MDKIDHGPFLLLTLTTLTWIKATLPRRPCWIDFHELKLMLKDILPLILNRKLYVILVSLE